MGANYSTSSEQQRHLRHCFSVMFGAMANRAAEDTRKRSPVVRNAHDYSKRLKSENKFRLKQLTGFPRSFTRTNDEIHRTIDMCPVMKALADTKQMQRLRQIKQL